MTKNNNEGYPLATENEVRHAWEEFPEEFFHTKANTNLSIASIYRELSSYFQTHKKPDAKNRTEYLSHEPGLTSLKELQEQGLGDTEEDKKFDAVFDKIFVEEYKKQYITPAYLGQMIGKRKEMGLTKTPGMTFLYNAKAYDESYNVHRKMEKFVRTQWKELETAKTNGTLSQKEIADREKNLWIIQAMDRDSLKLTEQYNYLGSRSYLMNDQKDALIRATSQKLFDRCSARVGSSFRLLTYQAAQYGDAMANVANMITPTNQPFDQMKTGLKYYQNELYQSYSRKYDLIKVIESDDLSAESKSIVGSLGTREMEKGLNNILKELSSQHRIGFHSDSSEMKNLKSNLKDLIETMQNCGQRVMESKGNHALVMQDKLMTVLESAQNYLTAKDKEGKTLSDRSKMGSTRYQAAQALVERLQKVKNNMDRAVMCEQLDARIATASDPHFRTLLEKQKESKLHLAELADKPQWNAIDRSILKRELAFIVARQKLEMEYLNTKNTNGRLWKNQKHNENFTYQVARTIENDLVIKNCADQMKPHQLMAFISQNGERKLNLAHSKEMKEMLIKKEPSTSLKTSTQSAPEKVHRAPNKEDKPLNRIHG